MEHLERSIAEGLLSIGAVFFRPNEPFTWASGIKSPIYCDNRLILTAPDGAHAGGKGPAPRPIRARLSRRLEVLMGTATAGIAHAAIVGHLMGLPMGYVRSGSKDHGRQNRIEGTPGAGPEGRGHRGSHLHRRQRHRRGGRPARSGRRGAGRCEHLHLRHAEGPGPPRRGQCQEPSA